MRANLSCCLLAALCVLSGARDVCAKDSRQPRPDDAAVNRSVRVLLKLYDTELDQTKKRSKKIALARELLTLAKETNDDPADQFVLLYVARNMAAGAKGWGLVMEVIGEIVKRFQPATKMESDAMIREGEKLCAAAEKKPAKERLVMRLNAAEWFVYAKENGGLQGKLAEKRLRELGEKVGGKRRKRRHVNDVNLLIGAWNIKSEKNRKDTWTFFPDGAVKNSRKGKGIWILEPDVLMVVWLWNKKGKIKRNVRDIFYRPLNASGTAGIAAAGHKLMARKTD